MVLQSGASGHFYFFLQWVRQFHWFPNQLLAEGVLAVLIERRWWSFAAGSGGASSNSLCFHSQNWPHLYHSHTELLLLTLDVPKPYENKLFFKCFCDDMMIWWWYDDMMMWWHDDRYDDTMKWWYDDMYDDMMISSAYIISIYSIISIYQQHVSSAHTISIYHQHISSAHIISIYHQHISPAYIISIHHQHVSSAYIFCINHQDMLSTHIISKWYIILKKTDKTKTVNDYGHFVTLYK